MSAVFVLVAVTSKDAEEYLAHHTGDVRDARQHYLGGGGAHLEGLRVAGAFATSRARQHPGYALTMRALSNGYARTSSNAPRVL